MNLALPARLHYTEALVGAALRRLKRWLANRRRG